MFKKTAVNVSSKHKYIFDIDHTLYSDKDFTDSEDSKKYYESFKQKRQLSKLLKKLSGPKFILTNANMPHAEDVLDRLFLKNIFQDIIASDVAGEIFKPHQDIYHIAKHEFKLKSSDKVYFFEDDEDNLKAAKKNHNWITILINPRKIKKPEYVDYVFTTIEKAVSFFIAQQNLII
tara:strand:+ start:370 stop:897 length:528 start_codon:yes stop_codon:yes gene_type:complete